MTDEPRSMPIEEDEIVAQLRAAYDSVEDAEADGEASILVEMAVDEDDVDVLDGTEEPTSEELE
jgi:hypothetical protein